MKHPSFKTVVCLLALASVVACGRGRRAAGNAADSIDDVEEPVQSVGDVMASADDSSGKVDGAFAFYAPAHPEFRPSVLENAWDALVPDAHAESCYALTTFGTCMPSGNSASLVRTFNNCSVGATGVTMNGDVTLNWTGTNCRLDMDSEAVTRSPNFTITGRRGATLTVSGGGQTVTRTGAEHFTYNVAGLDRHLKDSAGNTVAHVVTDTTSAISITGTSRANRVMTGGVLRVHHLVAQYTANWVPNNLTWDGTCNCAVSGTLTGSIKKDAGDSGIHEAVITVTGCGTASVDVDGEVSNVTFDRCQHAL